MKKAFVKEIPAPTPFEIEGGDKESKWACLREVLLADKICNEHLAVSKKLVFGTGNLDADIFFCGEAPGANEEEQGEPFVGQAGKTLDKIISAIGLERADVYISNIMNWRPQTESGKGNRAPTSEEIAYCLPYLKAQIDIVKPKIVIALGSSAVKGLLGFSPKMKDLNGIWQKYMQSDLRVMYHPSYIMQWGKSKPEVMEALRADIVAVANRLSLPIKDFVF